MPSKTLDYLSTLQLPGVGAKTARRIGASLGPCSAVDEGSSSPSELHRSLLEIHWLVPRFTMPSMAAVEEAIRKADAIVADCTARNIKILGLDSPLYPDRLRSLADAPPILYALGHVEALHAATNVAVIGTREPSECGRKMAWDTGRKVAEAGYVVVSGLALGCDYEAHEGCLSASGVGVAVLAHGLHMITPSAHRGLADRLAKGGGCLVSEYPPGVAPQRPYYVARDRLQSGLSDCVIVIETGETGGTLHTVGFAEKQGRRVAAILHPEDYRKHPKAAGNAMLIGAGRAASIADFDALALFIGGTPAVAPPAAQ
jgi:DNA processing protein